MALQHNGPTLFALDKAESPAPRSQRRQGWRRGQKRRVHISEADGGKPDVILIGTGSEVALCAKAQEKLRGYGIKARVVSMPSWNLFDEQDEVIAKACCRKRSTNE